MTQTPQLIVFDVNETLSDLSTVGNTFAEVGATKQHAKTWFASVLRDGFALGLTNETPAFADVARGCATVVLSTADLSRPLDEAVDAVMASLKAVTLHPDVVDGIRELSAAGFRLVTLSNGSTAIAQKLFEEAGIDREFERLLSVEGSSPWKPAHESYEYAAGECGVALGEMALVAVHPWDTHGAARAGLTAVWVDRDGSTYPPHFAAPAVTVSSLAGLAAHLTQG